MRICLVNSWRLLLLQLLLGAWTVHGAHTNGAGSGSSGGGSGNPAVCSCSFAVPEVNETGCRVYGALPGQSNLVAWYTGNKTCLQDMAAAVNGTLEYPFQDYLNICPYPNGTGFSAGGFAAFVQNKLDNSGPTARAILSKYPEFFCTQDNGTTYELCPNINDSTGSKLNCTSEPAFCWNQIEFELDKDPREGGFICSNAYPLMKKGEELLQGVLRKALCELSADARPQDCQPLVSQIEQVLSSDSGLNCSDLMVGSMNQSVPSVCTGPVDNNGNPIGPGGSTSGAAPASATTAAAAAVVWMASLVASSAVLFM